MKVLWVAYNTKDYSNPFGRKMVGYCGWHDNAVEAMAEARVRYPDVNVEGMQVNRV